MVQIVKLPHVGVLPVDDRIDNHFAPLHAKLGHAPFQVVVVVQLDTLPLAAGQLVGGPPLLAVGALGPAYPVTVYRPAPPFL